VSGKGICTMKNYEKPVVISVTQEEIIETIGAAQAVS
jgi:hypothetical protein